jgi:hypothetical protein
MVKIALFVVTMVKVARLGSGAPYAGSGRIKTVLGQIHLMIIQCIFFNCCHRELHGKTYTPC